MAGALQPGTLLYAPAENGKPTHALRLLSLFRLAGNAKTYGLLAHGHQTRPLQKGSKLFSDPMGERLGVSELGRLTDIDEVLPKDKTSKSLFYVFELHGLGRGDMVELAHSKGLARAAYSKHPMKIRKVSSHQRGTGKKANSVRRMFGPKGCIVSDLENVEIEIDGKAVAFDHAALAESFGKRPLVNFGDEGMPVLSTKNRLVGFAIGRENGEVLILPAEHLARTNNLTFVGPKDGSVVRHRARLQPRRPIRQWRDDPSPTAEATVMPAAVPGINARLDLA